MIEQDKSLDRAGLMNCIRHSMHGKDDQFNNLLNSYIRSSR